MRRKNLFIVIAFIVNLSFAQEKTEIQWWNPATDSLEVISGRGWDSHLIENYQRLPKKAQNNVSEALWNLSKHAAGLSIRFWSNAPQLTIKFQLSGEVSMPHMPATGVSGLDLYSKSYDGEWIRCWGNYRFADIATYQYTIKRPAGKHQKYGAEYQLFLPLYNEVLSLEIGIPKNFFIEGIPIRKEKPIVVYGTSIAQGACASRPGMAWTSILERTLERPVVNLGFSGNGKLDPYIIEKMSEIDSKLYILDCLPNLNPNRDDVYQLTIDAVNKLKSTRPKTPIILTAHPGYSDGFTNLNSQEFYENINEALASAYTFLKDQGVHDIYLLKKDQLALDQDSFVDKIHPNDVGMLQYAKAYEKVIRKAIHEPKGSHSTTIPLTQSRDVSVYNWESRHQEILKLNKSDPPEICYFGNSIVHFWAGEPMAKIQRGTESWNNYFKSPSVRNFGFGWDRIENVLWRVYHDEIEGIKPKKIVLMLGTNNLHLNTDNEIIEGLSLLIDAIQIRQPETSILTLGILPRRDGEKRIENLNSFIAQLAKSKKLTYHDLGEPFIKKNGYIDETLFVDGLHPNKKGYELLAKQLHKYLKKN